MIFLNAFLDKIQWVLPIADEQRPLRGFFLSALLLTSNVELMGKTTFKTSVLVLIFFK